jgi:hypothetical protein
MRLQSRKPVPAILTREERLRKGRATAETIRTAAPRATVVEVQLEFPSGTAAEPFAAAQSFLLYPGARAYFAYPCPHGDCDGIYDLAAEAEKIMAGDEARVCGIAECEGQRARRGLPRQLCGQHVSYSIRAQLLPEELS